MEKNFVLNGNKLISEFRGQKCKEGFWMYNSVGNGVTHCSQMHYHCSWDWLMPVVAEIQKYQQAEINKNGKIGLALPMIIGIEKSFERSINIEKTFNKVLIFIRWYSRNNLK